MKKRVIYIALLLLGLVACDDKWNEHYSDERIVVEGSNVAFVEGTAQEYLKSTGSLSAMCSVFERTGLLDSLSSKDQQYTLIVTSNEALEGVDLSRSDAEYLISDVPVAPSHLKDGQRLLMWNGKYLTVGIEADAVPAKAGNSSLGVTFNGVKVRKIIKTDNGYIFELESLVKATRSMYEMIEELDDVQYSLFKDMVLGQNVNVFDKANSTPVGVDKSGNTVYDSVFVISNPLFDKLNIMSEYVSGTMLIPSNEVLKECLQTAYDTKMYAVGEPADAEDSLKFESWVLQSLFFDKKYAPEEYEAETDIKSAFGNQWRTTVQKVNTANPVELSNGIAYYVDFMEVPMNKVIYRIKHFFWYWDVCTAEQKAEYFKWTNVDETKLNVKYDEVVFTPKAGEWPEVHNNVLYAEDVDETQPYVLEFTALIKNGDQVEPARIPAGEYTLCMGFKQHKSNGYKIKVSVNGEYINTVSLGSSTTFHYDRGAGSFPEGYDSSTKGYSKGTSYDRDGGTVGKVTLTGEGLQKMVIRIESDGPMPSGQKFDGHHWCLRPTDNNY